MDIPIFKVYEATQCHKQLNLYLKCQHLICTTVQATATPLLIQLHRTHIGDTERIPGFELQPCSASSFAAIYRVSQRRENLSLWVCVCNCLSNALNLFLRIPDTCSEFSEFQEINSRCFQKGVKKYYTEILFCIRISSRFVFLFIFHFIWKAKTTRNVKS